MVALPKISIGKKTKRSYFDLTHDVNTTSDFGFCQPTICREFYKDSKISLKTRQFVRLGAMPCPTFGRIEVKTHTAFVPVRETFLAYDYFQAQKTVTSANRSYIPQCADYVTANTVLGSIIELILDNKNYYDNSGTLKFIDSTRFFGRFSIWMVWHEFCPQNHEFYSQHSPFDAVDIVNDDVIIQHEDMVKNSVRIIMQLFTNSAANTENIQTSPFYNVLKDSEHFNRSDVGNINTKTGVNYLQLDEPSFYMFAYYKSNRRFFVDWNPYPDYPANSVGVRFAQSYNYLQFLNEASDDFLQPLSYDKPDFTIGYFDCPYTDFWGNTRTYSHVAVNLHLTRAGRRLYKVLTGCRISFGTRFKKIDLMRLFSYYKVWFDKYNPGRNLQWLDTNAFGLIHSFYDYGSVLDNVINGVGTDYSRIPNDTKPRYKAFWYNFLAELSNCCYVLPIDNMTCATPTPLLEIQNNMASINDLDVYFSNDSNVSANADVTNTQIYGDSGLRLRYSGGLGIQLLDRIYHLVNKNSVIGSKIDEYLKAHNISRGLPHSNVLGDSKFMCAIDDVFSTSGTDDAVLGEYAGKGIGNGSSDTMHFETESFGYLIQIMCIVPLGGYVQGMRDCPINRFDFYQPEFDSLGMEPMSHSNFINRRFDYSTFDANDTVFGFRPRYFGLKIENNLANGGFSLQSQQTQFLPYCLDRIFDIKKTQSETEDYVADEELRYIGRYEKFGNYDRIFYDTTGLTDNFIVHMIQEFGMYAPMKSISDSYETFDKDVDDADINVKKA